MKNLLTMLFCLLVVCISVQAQSGQQIINDLELGEEQIAEQGLDVELSEKDMMLIVEINEFYTTKTSIHGPTKAGIERSRKKAIMAYLKDRTFELK